MTHGDIRHLKFNIGRVPCKATYLSLQATDRFLLKKEGAYGGYQLREVQWNLADSIASGNYNVMKIV